MENNMNVNVVDHDLVLVVLIYYPFMYAIFVCYQKYYSYVYY